MKQVPMEYWETDIGKVNEFNFLNEKVEKFTSRWSQNLVNVRIPSYLNQKTFECCLRGITDYIFNFLFEHGDVLLVWVKYMIKYIHICIKVLMHDKSMRSLTLKKAWKQL